MIPQTLRTAFQIISKSMSDSTSPNFDDDGIDRDI